MFFWRYRWQTTDQSLQTVRQIARPGTRPISHCHINYHFICKSTLFQSFGIMASFTGSQSISTATCHYINILPTNWSFFNKSRLWIGTQKSWADTHTPKECLTSSTPYTTTTHISLFFLWGECSDHSEKPQVVLSWPHIKLKTGVLVVLAVLGGRYRFMERVFIFCLL